MTIEAGDGKATLEDVVGLCQLYGAIDELQFVFFALDTLTRKHLDGLSERVECVVPVAEQLLTCALNPLTDYVQSADLLRKHHMGVSDSIAQPLQALTFEVHPLLQVVLDLFLKVEDFLHLRV